MHGAFDRCGLRSLLLGVVPRGLLVVVDAALVIPVIVGHRGAGAVAAIVPRRARSAGFGGAEEARVERSAVVIFGRGE